MRIIVLPVGLVLMASAAQALAARKDVRRSWLCAVFLLGLLAASTAHADGPVIGWGLDNDGQALPPASVDGTSGTASAIAAGGFHSCAIQTGTGNVVCWGWASRGCVPKSPAAGTRGELP